MNDFVQINSRRSNIAIVLAVLSVVVASLNTLLFLYEFNKLQPGEIVEITSNDEAGETLGESPPLVHMTEQSSVTTVGPSFQELNIAPPPPVTNRSAYDEWVKSYGEAYLEYEKDNLSETENLEGLDIGIPSSLAEEDWLESELNTTQTDTDDLTADELRELSQQLLEEYRSR